MFYDSIKREKRAAASSSISNGHEKLLSIYNVIITHITYIIIMCIIRFSSII